MHTRRWSASPRETPPVLRAVPPPSPDAGSRLVLVHVLAALGCVLGIAYSVAWLLIELIKVQAR